LGVSTCCPFLVRKPKAGESRAVKELLRALSTAKTLLFLAFTGYPLPSRTQKLSPPEFEGKRKTINLIVLISLNKYYLSVSTCCPFLFPPKCPLD